MSGGDHNQADETPRCPMCEEPVTDMTQHYRFYPSPRDPLKDGEPGVTLLGDVQLDPCGHRLTPAEARSWGWVVSS